MWRQTLLQRHDDYFVDSLEDVLAAEDYTIRTESSYASWGRNYSGSCFAPTLYQPSK